MILLTATNNTINLLPIPPHVEGGFSTPNKAAIGRKTQCGFFMPVKNDSLRYGGVCGAVERLAGTLSGVENPTFATAKILSTMAGGLSYLLQGLITMKHLSPVHTGQKHQKTKPEPRFEVFQHGVLIASNLNIYAAIGLKSVFQATTVKFAEFAKAGV